MSIKFNPQNNSIQLNNKEAEFYLDLTKDNFIDMYILQINGAKDLEILKLLKFKIPNSNAKLTIIDRRTQAEYTEEYKDGKCILKPNYRYFDDTYFCFVDNEDKNIVIINNIEKFCFDVYKKYIEKYVLARCNKFNNNYFMDIYLFFDNVLYKDIFNKMQYYFED